MTADKTPEATDANIEAPFDLLKECILAAKVHPESFDLPQLFDGILARLAASENRVKELERERQFDRDVLTKPLHVKIEQLEAELADLRAKGTPAQSDIACAIATRALISEGYNDGDIESVIAAHVAPLRAQLDEAVADSDAWQTVACFLTGLMIPVGQFDVRRLFQWVRSGKDLTTLPTGDAEKGAGDE